VMILDVRSDILFEGWRDRWTRWINSAEPRQDMNRSCYLNDRKEREDTFAGQLNFVGMHYRRSQWFMVVHWSGT
jgi:hypothetical protein